MSDPIFVFGSNLAGRHGKGAALFAKRHRGAIYGMGAGPQGRSYAIPTKGFALEPLALETIRQGVMDFLIYAYRHPAERFEVTAIGCGLAGYKPADIAPMFATAPANCDLPPEFMEVLDGR